MNKEGKCCGTCLFHRRDRQTKEWTCSNEQSDNYGLETDYNECCQDYEERE